MSVTVRTDVGPLKIELFCEQVPKACENFLALCASDYYNGCLFHRNIKDFMVQTGDPTGTGKGGNSIWGHKFEDEFREGLKTVHLKKTVECIGRNVVLITSRTRRRDSIVRKKHNNRGILSMANNGPDTNGSQWFIIYNKQPHLNMKYTMFGRVIDGFETLDELEKLPVHENYRPLNDVRITDVTIHANPLAN